MKTKTKTKTNGKELKDNNDGMPTGTVVTDSRFVHLHSDPRFQRIARNNAKVSIDSRFQHMFADKNFSESLAFDKRGRPKKKKESNRLHQYYYHLNQEEEEQEEEDNKDEQNEENDEGVLASNGNATENIKKKKNKNKDKMKHEERPTGFTENVCGDENAYQNTLVADEEDKLGVTTTDTPTKKKKKKTNAGLGDLEETIYAVEGHEINLEVGKKKKKKNKNKFIDGIDEQLGKMYTEECHGDNPGVESKKAKKRNKIYNEPGDLEENMYTEEDPADIQGSQHLKGQQEQVTEQLEEQVNMDSGNCNVNTNVGSKSKKKKYGRQLMGSRKEMCVNDQSDIVIESQVETVRDDSDKSKLKQNSIFGTGKKGNMFQEEDSEIEDYQETSESESLSNDYLHSSECEESETSSSSDDDELVELESPKQEEVPTMDHETRRLAVVNMDWNHIKAVDLLVLMNSFLPKGGQILSVAIYPSEIGLKQMAEEAVHGPAGIFASDNESSEDDQNESENEKLRQYEKARLSYYYAVIECDTCATSDYLYKACDGVEFERTSNVLDLRFIPDDMKFDPPPRDVATGVPTNYEAPDFHTRALQHSKVNFTWDDDEPLRVKTLHQKFNPDQLNEMDFKAYLASDDDESDDGGGGQDNRQDGENKKKSLREKYQSLLLGSGDPSEGEEDKDDKDMEITFNTGLEELSKRILEKSQKSNSEETVWEAYLRKRSEKRKARKNRAKGSSEDELSISDREDVNRDEGGDESDDFFLDDEALGSGKKAGKSVNVKKGSVSGGNVHKKQLKLKTQSMETKGEEDVSKAELELLLADDHGLENGARGYNLKSKKSKGRKQKELPSEDKLPTVDYDDPRFSALFTSHHFAIDPTDPQFKRSAAYGRSLAQKQQKKFADKTVDDVEPVILKQVSNDDSSSKKRKTELSSLIRSVKRKVGILGS